MRHPRKQATGNQRQGGKGEHLRDDLAGSERSQQGRRVSGSAEAHAE